MSFYRGMIMLIAASPCALAASAVPATLSGISNLAKQGVLFKGGSYLSNLANTKVAAFDKTGTLTEGKPVVTDTYFVEKQQAEWTNIIVAMEKNANHPLATAILNEFSANVSIELQVENQIGQGLVSTYNGNNYRIGKPSTFIQTNDLILQLTEQYSREGKTVVYFAINEEIKGLIAMMDIAKHLVQVAGETIELTPKEFGILYELMKEPEVVKTRDDLLNEIWGYEYDGQTNVVDVYIRTLRNKLDVCGKGKMIATVRGLGYVLRTDHEE